MSLRWVVSTVAPRHQLFAVAKRYCPCSTQSYLRDENERVIPEDLFEKWGRLARRTNRSRSEVLRAALREHVARHDAEQVTDA
jgi:hypothetical protein